MQHSFNCHWPDHDSCTNVATDIREKRLGHSIWVKTVCQHELLRVRFGRLIVYWSVSPPPQPPPILLAHLSVNFLPFWRWQRDEAKGRSLELILAKVILNILIPSFYYSTFLRDMAPLSLSLSTPTPYPLSQIFSHTHPKQHVPHSLILWINRRRAGTLSDICRNNRLKYKHSSPGGGGRASEWRTGGWGETWKWAVEGVERWRDCRKKYERESHESGWRWERREISQAAGQIYVLCTHPCQSTSVSVQHSDEVGYGRSFPEV